MAEINKVIVRYMDGRIARGTTDDFFPGRAMFHLHPLGGGPFLELQCKQLKAVFFVRDFAGDPQRVDTRGFPPGPGDPNLGKKVAVVFKDGELLCGYTLTFSPDKNGFFLSPAYPSTNNIRVCVFTHATREIGAGIKADALVEKTAPRKAA